MLKKHSQFFMRLMIGLDALVVVFGAMAAYVLISQSTVLYPPVYYLWLLPILAFIWSCLLIYLGMYESFRIKPVHQVLGTICVSAVVGFIIFGNISYLCKLTYLSRFLMVSSFGLGALLLAVEKILFIIVIRRLRRKGFNFRNVLIVGTGQRACQLIEQINAHKEFGLNIIGLIDDDPLVHGQTIAGHTVLGGLSQLPHLLRTNPVDRVIFVVPRGWLSYIEEAVLYCETLGVTVSVAVDLFKTRFTFARDEDFMGIPMISFESTSDKVGQLFVKRLLDIFIAGIGMIVLAPLFFAVAILVKLTSPGPIFFEQKRCSLNGRTFRLIKFRTMVVDAESKLKGLLKHNEMSGPAFKMANDPRITPVGRFLRKTSLDELPQLLNVLRGEMSLVGPRPPLPQEVEQYDHWQRRRLSMRPGITCLWQIGGRNKITDFNEWSRLDLEYIDSWSLGLDIKILAKTIPVVLFHVGAK
jgi:exopolysaccharide biosynthesis polyprenyl glycosylphosphotransferase